MGLFFDELCLEVKSCCLASGVKRWILYRFSIDLEENFLGDLNESTSSQRLSHDYCDLIVNEIDKAMVSGTTSNPVVPKAELRFNIDKDDAMIYIRLLSLLASDDPFQRDVLPQLLCPLLCLLVSIHDGRFGGDGLVEIDAVLGCPLLLPDETSSVTNFELMSTSKQWVTVSCLFFAVCWCR